MDTQTFIEQMKRLDDRFSKGRELAPSTAQVYKDELYRIPSEAFRDIVRRLIKYNRAYPTPGEIDELWRDWQQTHPDKVFDDKKGTPCDPCNSKGYFDFEFVPKWIRQHPDFKKKDPIWYEGVVNCAHCKTYPMAKKVVGSMFLSDFDTEEYMRLFDAQEKREKLIRIIKDKRKLIEKALPVFPEIPDESEAKEKLRQQAVELQE